MTSEYDTWYHTIIRATAPSQSKTLGDATRSPPAVKPGRNCNNSLTTISSRRPHLVTRTSHPSFVVLRRGGISKPKSPFHLWNRSASLGWHLETHISHLFFESLGSSPIHSITRSCGGSDGVFCRLIQPLARAEGRVESFLDLFISCQSTAHALERLNWSSNYHLEKSRLCDGKLHLLLLLALLIKIHK